MSELTPQARAFLRAHKGDGQPSADDAERVRAAIDASLAAGAAGTVGVGTAAAVKKLSLLKVFVIAVGLGAASTVAVRKVVAVPSAPPPQQRVRPVVGAVPGPVRVAPVVEQPVVPPQEVVAQPKPADVEPVLVNVAPTTPRKSVAPPAPEPMAPSPKEAEPVVAAVVAAPPPAPAPEPVQPVIAAPPVPRPDEMWLVTRAQSLLRSGKQSEALDVLRQWDEHYGARGQFGEEARAAQVIAMCELGHADARKEAARYLEQYPASVQRNRVERACK